GNITFAKVDSTTGVITRANGSDLGNFIAEGFQKNMRIHLSGSLSGADGDWVIVDLDATTLTVTPAPTLPGGAPGALPSSTMLFSNVFIDQLADKGVYQGDIAYDPNGIGQTLYTGDLTISGTTLTRTTGSFIDDQFMVGARIAVFPTGSSTSLGTL